MLKSIEAEAHLTATVDQRIHGLLDGWGRGVTRLHLGLKVVLIVGPHHKEIVTPFVHSDLCFGLNYCVYSSN